MSIGSACDGFMGKLSEIEIEEFEYVPTRRRVKTGSLKVGKVIRKGKKLSMTEVLPDDPIYTRGFVIGGKTLGSSSRDTKEQSLNDESNKQTSLPGKDKEITSCLEEGIYGAAIHQMSRAEEQDSSTGQPKKDSKG